MCAGWRCAASPTRSTSRSCSLYRLFPSRGTLLGSVAEYVIDELHTDPGLLLNAAGRWQDYLGRLAHDVRRTALSHPQLFLLTATLPPTSRWTGPPLPSLRCSESFLSALARYGFADEAAAGVFRVFRRFLLGELLGEVVTRNVAPPRSGMASTPTQLS